MESIASDINLFPLVDYSYKSVEFFIGANLNQLSGDFGAYNIDPNNNISKQIGFSINQSLSKFFGFNFGLVFKQTPFSFDWNNTENNVYFNLDATELSENSPIQMVNSNLYADLDNDNMLPFVSSSGLNDSRIIKTLLIPLNIEFKYDNPESFTFYFFGGVQLIYKLSSEISANGEFVTQAYYPDFDFTLHDLPDYGYTTEVIEASYTVKSSMFSFSPYGGTGIRMFVSEKIGFDIKFLTVLPLNNDFLLEYENSSEMYKFSPEYTVNQFLSEQLKISTDMDNTNPWIENRLDSFEYSSFGVNLGLFYKF